MWPKEDEECEDIDFFDEECGCRICPECGRHSTSPRIIDVILVPATLGTMELSFEKTDGTKEVSTFPHWSAPIYAQHPYPSEPRIRRYWDFPEAVFVGAGETMRLEMTITLGG